MPAAVRLATPDDADECLRLAALMFSSMGLDVSGERWREEALDGFRARAGDDLVAAVVDHPGGGGLVSSGAITFSRRLPSPLNPTGSAAYVQWVATDVEFRRRGLGEAVMQRLLDEAWGRGVRMVELHATVDGEPLYRRLGFDEAPSVALRHFSPVP